MCLSPHQPGSSTVSVGDVTPLFLFPLQAEGGSQTQVLFDTCAARSACPPDFASSVPVKESDEIPLVQADGTRVAHYGQKSLDLVTTMGNPMKLAGSFDVKGVSRPIMAAGAAVDSGHGVWLHKLGSMIVHSGMSDKVHKAVVSSAGGSVANLVKERGVFVLPVRVPEHGTLCPLEEHEAIEQVIDEARTAFYKDVASQAHRRGEGSP